MRYLFFDIECADGCMAVCEFGYVLTDEKFNVLKHINRLIDPETKFNLTGRPGQADLILTYPYAEYRKYYPFDDSYEFIRDLMTQKDLMIFGHAVTNDIAFLFKDCQRYHLDLFDYTAYDIQKMLPVFDKENRRFTSLENAFEELVPFEVRKDLKDHRASDDAMKTMLVLKEMVEKLGFSPKDLIESCPKSVCKALEHWEKSRIKKAERKQRLKNEAAVREGNKILSELLEEHMSKRDDPNSIGRIVTLSKRMKQHHDELRELIEVIKTKGYVLYDQITGSDFFILFDEENRKEMETVLKYPYPGKMLTYQEFLDMNK